MISRNQDSGRIRFLENALFSDKEPTKSEPKISEAGGNISVPERPSTPVRSNNNKGLDMNVGANHYILSAGQGDITDEGGPSQQMGTRSNNSIWDNDVLSRIIDQTTSKEETEQQKGRIDKLRNSLRDGRIDDMVDAIKTTETRTEATVSQSGNYFESKNYKSPKTSIGIFDNNDFSNVPEQTHGEKVAMEARQAKEKDESWKDIRGTHKVKSTLDTFFDTLTKE